jgi:hypothetical protein
MDVAWKFPKKILGIKLQFTKEGQIVRTPNALPMVSNSSSTEIAERRNGVLDQSSGRRCSDAAVQDQNILHRSARRKVNKEGLSHTKVAHILSQSRTALNSFFNAVRRVAT